MTKTTAKIKLTILATLGHKLMDKEMDDLANALQEIIKEQVTTAYNVGKHNALDNIEITSEEYYNQILKDPLLRNANGTYGVWGTSGGNGTSMTNQTNKI